MRSIKERIRAINAVITDLKAQREHIQDKECTHSEFRVRYWSDAPGRVYPTKVCDFCGKDLGAPEDHELYKELMFNGDKVIHTIVPDPDFYYNEEKLAEAWERIKIGKQELVKLTTKSSTR